MSSRSIHVAAAQIHSGGTVEENILRLHRQAQAAAIVGAQFILFAEGSLHGYDYGMTLASVRRRAQPIDGPDAMHVSAIAQELGLVILAGMFEADGQAIYNSMLIAWPDGRREMARKHQLTQGELAAGLVPADPQRTIIQVNGVRCGVVICADIAIPGLHEDLLARQCDLKLCPTGGGGSIHDTLDQADLLTPAGMERYVKNRLRVFRPEAVLPEADRPGGLGFVSANALGPVGESTFHQGHCMIVDSPGVMRAQIPGTIVRQHAQDQMIHACLQM